MTQSEFYEAQRQSRIEYRKVFQQVNKDLGDLYIDAADEVAEKIKTLNLKGKGKSLTAASLKSLETTLRKTGARIAGGSEQIIINSIDDSITITNQPHLTYWGDALGIADIDRIEFGVIEKMYSQLNETLIGLTHSRVWQDGYNFSDRIWGFPGSDKQPYLPGFAKHWEFDVKKIVTMGLAQNRDVLQIAKDLTVYAVHGKKGVMKRYGDLVEGTSAFAKRIPKHIDWRALRLARSELFISLQDAAKFQGKMNPAVRKYKWNLTGGVTRPADDPCPDIAADSPYLVEEVPDYPHPNGMCYITHIIIGRDEFVNDLVDWGQGVGVPYLDNWYVNQYLPAI